MAGRLCNVAPFSIKGYDCFRHYEMLLGGNIALVPDDSSLRSFMNGLPAFFFRGAYMLFRYFSSSRK